MTQTPLIDEPHTAVQLLLPWYMTGRIDVEERAMVAAHLEACATCRAELEIERRIARQPGETAPAVDAGWAAMMARLDEPASLPVDLTGVHSWARRDRRRWMGRGGHASGSRLLRWVVAGQSVAIAVLATWMVGSSLLAPQAIRGDYRALSAATEAPPGNVLAMFRPTTPESELRRLLTVTGARVVNGPTSAGAYVLMVPGGVDGRAIETLRHSSAVTMAEPIEGEALP